MLFPESYTSTAAWLRGLMDPAEDALFAAQQRLLAALDDHPDFGRLAGGLVVKARTKSLFSVMKKLLHLGDLARGGRRREVSLGRGRAREGGVRTETHWVCEGGDGTANGPRS